MKRLFNYLCLLMLLILGSTGQVWAGDGWLFLFGEAGTGTGKGLVVAKTTNSAPTDADYKFKSQSGSQTVSDNNGTKYVDFFGWAKPARGYQFSSWSITSEVLAQPSYILFIKGDVMAGTSLKSTGKDVDGVEDVFSIGGGRNTNAGCRTNVVWTKDGSAEVKYAQTAGGSYTVTYGYYKVKNVGVETASFEKKSVPYTVSPTSGNVMPSDTDCDGNPDSKSYVHDDITLSTTATNFLRWEVEDGTTHVRTTLEHITNGNTKSCKYQVENKKNVTIHAIFKNADLGEIGGDKQINVDNVSTVYNYALTVPVTNILGDGWDADCFEVTFSTADGPATIVKGEPNYAPGMLTIPFTYKANKNGNTTVDVSVKTIYSDKTVNAQIIATAKESVAWEAEILLNGEEVSLTENRGTLAAMLAKANGLSGDFVLRLRNDVEINEPLSFTNSFVFNTDGQTITSTGVAAISIDATGINVVVEDGSFTKTGKIVVSGSLDGIKSVVRFTSRGQLTLNGGELSVENTSAGANAKAYGIYVSNSGVFSMTAGSFGQLTVAGINNAVGVYVATENDYATLRGGKISVSANTNAYGIWTAGGTNVKDAKIVSEALSGTGAYGVYVNGKAATLENTEITSLASTQLAYGAFVADGQLNYIGGSIDASAPTTAYGAHIAASATAVFQLKATLTTNTSGATTIGINNQGIVRLLNASVGATAGTTDAVAVYSNTSATTTIEEGAYTATAGTGNAYAINHLSGKLDVDGGTYAGILLSSGSNAIGVHLAGDADILNAIITADAKNGSNTAYGVWADYASANILLKDCSIAAQSATSLAYAIRSKATLDATGCQLEARVLGTNTAHALYAESGTNTLTNCNATIYANETQAWGINHVAGSCSVIGGSYNITAAQASAGAAANTQVYGVQTASGKTTILKDASFVVNASNVSYSQAAYGVYASGTVSSDNCSYQVNAFKNAYGVYGDGTSTLNLKNNTIAVEVFTTKNEDANAYGFYSNKNFTIDGDNLSAIAHTKTAYAMNFGSSAVGNVLGGKFAATATSGFGPLTKNGTIGKVVLKGGYYSTSVNLQYYTASTCDIFKVDSHQQEYTEGYNFVIAEENPTPYVCYIGDRGFETLEGAMQYAIDNTGTQNILMTQPYVLPAGDYTLPHNATLLIPYSASQPAGVHASPTKHFTAEMLDENIRLTLASGVKWNVDGKIEVSAKMYCTNAATSYVQGAYGCMEMQTGSLLQLNNGARLYAWGYIIGKGEIIAKEGSEVHEMFRVQDMPAIGTLNDHLLDYKTLKQLPFNQYYIQNIEVPTTYYYNSKLITSMYKGYGNKEYGDDNVRMIGTPANATEAYLFQITDDNEQTWVRKEYDAVTDRQIWTIGSRAEVGSMSLDFDVLGMSVHLNTKDYILPLTGNMTLNIQEGGCLALTQSVLLAPGAEININKTASLVINEKDTKNANISFYVFGKEQWHFSKSGVSYSPTWNKGTAPSRSFVDAVINVSGGKIIVNGNFYTTDVDRYLRDRQGNIVRAKETTTGTYGANIYSSNANAGTVFYNKAASSTTAGIRFLQSRTYNLYNSDGTPKLDDKGKQMTESRDSIAVKDVAPAMLKNGNGEYTSTENATTDYSYVYMNNAWVETFTDGCFESIDGVFYAKPAEYVALANPNGETDPYNLEKDDHTYETIDGSLLICQEAQCEWWEVVPTDDPAVFECKKAGFEGFYSYNTEWELVKRNVTFYMDEAKTESTKKVVSVNYMGIPDQSVIASNPTKATTAAATYAFFGWKSSVTGTVYAWTDKLEKAKNDMYYTPVFTETPRNYTVTLVDANNGDAKVEVAYGNRPQFDPTKDADAQYTYTFSHWEDNNGVRYATLNDVPVVSTENGLNPTYTAIWSAVTNLYTVTWKDGDEVLEVDKNQRYGLKPSYDGPELTKEANDNYAYTFSGWSPAITGETIIEGDITYTAVYSTTPRYMITFANYDGTVLQKEATTAGEHPAYSGTPRRDADRDGYFRFDGWMDGDGETYAIGVELPVVSKKQTYTAQWTYVTTVYYITFANINGNGASTDPIRFGEDEIPSYDVAKESTVSEEYTLDYWVATSNGEHYTDPLPKVTKTETYTAVFTSSPRKYTIIWKNYDGSTLATDEVAYGTTPAYTGKTPQKPSTVSEEYTFAGWGTLNPVTGPAEYIADFIGSDIKFDITWIDGDGNIIYTERVLAGNTPAYDKVKHGTPAKASTDYYDYTFNDAWSPAIVAVSGDAVYRAQFNATEKLYTIIFKDEDGTILKTQENMHYGDQPSCDAPTRENTEATTYTFNGWKLKNEGTASKTIPTVTGNAEYYASFTETNNVAKVGSTAYATWDAAYGAVSDNGKITLLDDINFGSSKKTIQKTITLDLNGHTISGNVNQMITVQGTAQSGGTKTLTITDSKGDGCIKVTGSNQYPVYGTYNSYRSGWSTVYTYGQTVMNAGGIIGTAGTLSKYNSNNITITVNGGYFSHNDIKAASGKTLLELAKNHPKYAQGYRYVVETAHNVIWEANNGSTSTQVPTASGTPIAKPADPVKTGCEFAGWKLNGELVDFSEPIYMSATADMTFEAQWIQDELVADNETMPISEDLSINNVTITETGALTIADGKTVTVLNNLYLAAVPDNNLGSSITGNIEVAADANAYIDIDMNGSGAMNKSYYYSFAVPFNVDINGGVFRMENGIAVPAKPNTEFRVWTYSESNRATGMSDATWIQQTAGTLVPGVFYLLQVATNNTNTYRFMWNHTGNLNNRGAIENLSYTSAGSGDGAASGWHGVANNGLGYAKMSGNFEYVQMLNSELNTFEGERASTYPVAVGNPVFVQMTAAGDINMTASAPAAVAAAPRQVQANDENSIMTMQITKDGTSRRDDQIFISASEDALDEYEVGKDLSKMFMGTAKVAQMWINAYNKRLVANEAVMNNDRADFSLTMFAPAAAEYELNLRDIPSNVQVVLLQDGAPVADLSLMPYYTISLPQGETMDYSLVIMRRTPSTTTSIEHVGKEPKDAQKIFLDGKLYIVSSERVYDAQGKLVK